MTSGVIAVVAIVIHALLSFTQVDAQAQVAPEFEPVFQGGTYTVYVDEDTQSGETVTNIRAREIIHETLVYRFDPWSTNHDPPWIRPSLPNPLDLTVFNQDIYRINSADGTVTAGTEAQPHIRLSGNFIPAFTYRCTAWYASNDQLTSTIFVTFVSRDVSAAPTFTSSGRTFRILFTQPVGYVVTRFTARDGDLGPAGEFMFSMVQAIPNLETGVTYFAINQYTGDLSVLHVLPLIEDFRFQLEITAQDEGDSPLSSNITVEIFLNRPSAGPPVFSTNVYVGSIAEGTTLQSEPGFVVAVSATDPGHDPTTIIYSIVESEPEGDDVIFAVERISGQVTAYGPLDRERESRYLFHVRAEKEGLGLSSTATIVVNVMDVNEPPLFLNNHYIAWVSEHSNIGEPVHASISAVDYDEGQNGLIQYSISGVLGRATVHGGSTNELGSFRIDSFTGAIYVNTDLERELMNNGIHYYEITVIVTDGGLLTDDALVSINITDVNDNPPYFDPFQYIDSFPENQLAHFRFNFQAFDRDERDQATLTFYLQGPFNERFHVTTDRTIHSTNHTRPATETEGRFFVDVPLDREERDIYHLLIVAEDITFTPLLGYANVTINVLDLNDNNPIFLNDLKITFNVSEGSLLPEQHLLERLSVTDADIGINALVDFDITGGSPASYINHFSVVRTGDRTAELRITQEFDRENIDFFQFTITTTDQGTPRLTDTINRCLNVIDINDCIPVFNPVTYTNDICEGISIGTELRTITATDCDIGQNRIIHYSIESTEGLGLFTIDEITGVLSIAGEIDYEQTGPSIVVTVVGRDLGSPPNSATATVTINICDCNDNGPIVSAPDDGSCIRENSPTGTIVRRFTTTDGDTVSTNTDHVYEIEAGGINTAGDQVLCIPENRVPTITVCGTIDKEEPLDYITVTVRISNPGTVMGCGLPIPAPVRISYNICVDGYNDNQPEFVTYTIAVSIAECGGTHGGTAAGARVAQVQGFDRDRGEETVLTYTLAPLHPNFVLDHTSGIITVSTLGLDYETATSHSLVVYVEDNGLPNLRSAQTVAITVTVTDCNDNNPISPGLFTATIDEHTTPGTVVLTMSYTDADTLSPYGIAEFHIIGGPGSTFNHFTLSTAGVLTVRDEIDRESDIPSLIVNGECQAVYELTVELRDNVGGVPAETLTNTYTVIIYVNDINDNPPIFDPPTNDITVAENNNPPTAVDHALATDRDCGTNAELRYVITSQSSTANNPLPMPYFELQSSIDPTIEVTQILDRESDDNVFNVVVRAADQGTPSMSATYTLTVRVSDVNDHNPVLACPASVQAPCTFDVPENSPEDFTVVDRITSTDQDVDPTHNTITYSISNVPSPPFYIDPNTGVIVIRNGPLDCESIREYYLTVVGTDTSSDPDHIRRGSIVVHIRCVDVNDNCPVLQSGTMYAASVPENMPTGTLITLDPSIFVTDADITAPFRAVQYNLGDTTDFAMDSTTAVITTAAVFDRETQDSYTITFRVTNVAPGCGSPGFVSGTIIVTIEDENDHPPVWVPIPPIVLAECVGITTAITYMRPTDQDINENGRIYYRFGENHDEDFQINYETGDIRVFQELDRERMDSYSFDVIATDGGDVPLSASTTLSVTITDCNDQTPVCPASDITYTVVENTPAGTPVGTFLATDDDIGINEQITYTIVSGNSGGYFEILLPATPAIDVPITIQTASVRVDRETTPSVTLTIQAEDGGSTTRFCVGRVIIEILDENDNCPMFNNLVTTYNIREDFPGDNEITRLVATDIDTDESNRVPITYAITSITPTADIIIDSISGGLHTQSVDYERVQLYSITVSAADSGTPDPLTCSATITINIMDVNDNPPTAPDIYRNVSENSPPGTFVGRLVSGDVDTGLGGQIRYTLIDGNIGNAFTINNLDGVVTVMNNVIDRETLDEYTLTIRLNDLGDPNLSSTSMVFITVLDDNDCIPLFPQMLYTWSISEGSLPGQAFVDLAASDCDLTTNAEIDYSIIGGNIGFAFEATPEGHIRTATTLDRETMDFYRLTVMSLDRGVPALMHMTTVEVTVTDINDNTPIIMPFLSTTEVEEHDPIGYSVHQFVGGDADLGINALFYFNLSDTHDPLPFTLNSTGHLSISRDIDLESIANRQCEMPHYFLTVEIIDNGTIETIDHARSSVGHINITVRDINDHIPRFTDRELLICINENNTVGASVYTFTATDDDCEPQNIELYFFIVGGASADYFSVDVTTGTLRLAQTLDRETQDLHEIFVAVTNFNRDPAIDNYQLAMLSTTRICVEDGNDNIPQCLLNPYVVAISQDIGYGDEFSTIITTDQDIGNHSVVQYELIRENNNPLPFLIERDTGILTTIAVFHDKVGEMYEGRVRIYDNYGRAPSLENTCDIRVYVVSDEHRIIVVISLAIEFVRANITAITNIFQEATGCLIGVDTIRPRTSDDNVVLDISQTDIIMHGINPLSLEIKPRGPLIDTMDRTVSSINASVLRAVNAPIVEVRPYPTSGSDNQDLLIYYIIIAFLVTIALTACCCFICCYCWERRRRKLAHKELKSVVSLDQFEHTDTGIYQNPLWVQPYAEWQEESQSQEIVIDVEDDAISEANMIYASQELEIPVTHPGEEEESDDEQKNVEPPSYSDNYKKLGRFVGESQTGAYTMKQSTSSSAYQRTSTPQIDSYQEMPGDLGGGTATHTMSSGTATHTMSSGTATRTVSYKKTTSFKKTIEVPESTETVTVTHTASPIETEDEKAGLLTDDHMITFNYDD